METEIDPNIGRTWESKDGKKTIHELVHRPDGPRYLAGTKGPGRGGDLIPPEELEKWIKVDESWHKHGQEQEQRHVEAVKQEQVDLDGYENTDGFADQFPPMTRGKIRYALAKTLRYQGKRMTVKQLVRTKRAEGWFAGVDRIEHPNEMFLLTRDITTVWAARYMAYLVKRDMQE